MRGARAAEQGDAPVGALDLKMLHDGPSFINVRAAGDRGCSADLRRHSRVRPLILAVCGAVLCSLASSDDREPQLSLSLHLLGPPIAARPAIFTMTIHPDGEVRVAGDCRFAEGWPAAQPFCQPGRVHISAAGRARLRDLLLREQFFELRCCAMPVDLGERRITAELDGRHHVVAFLDLDRPGVPVRDAQAVLRTWYGALAEVATDGKVSVLPEDQRVLERQ
jgi:hypothetical protein